MDNLYRDISRLELITQDILAEESFSVKTRFSDFVAYFFRKFLSNISSINKPFAQSELQLFLMRHKDKSELLIKDPLLSLKDLLLPIPKGMQKSYLETLTELKSVLEAVYFSEIKEDLSVIVDSLNKTGAIEAIPRIKISSSIYEKSKKRIGVLYSNRGLMNIPGNLAFLNLQDVNNTKTMLLNIIEQSYSEVIEIHKFVNTIDQLHSDNIIDNDKMSVVRDSILDLAYRVSIFAVVMNHVQEIEHSFVKCLSVFITKR